MYQSGDVILIPFPFSDLKTKKRRPVLVLHPADDFGDMVCVAITSRSNHQQSLSINAESFIDGVLPRQSWVRYGKVYTLNESVIIGQFGALEEDVLDQVRTRFCQYFSC